MDAADIAVFSVVLGLSGFIGLYFGYKDRRNVSTSNYFFGSRSMNPIAVGMSILASYYSTIGFVSLPAECYITGTEYMWSAVIRFITVIPAIVYFIPALRRLNISTCYEFVEMRFNKPLRQVTAFFGIINSLIYAGIVVYVTSGILSVVAEIPSNWSIGITTVCCIFYTSLGGMKAVIWTDAAQFVFMIAGLLAILIKGILEVGGLDNVFAAAERGERNTMFRFDFGVISRVSPVARILGSISVHLSGIMNQVNIQRYQSCKTTSHARWASFLSVAMGFVIMLGLIGIGLVVFALYESCDPVRSGEIQSIDQIIPLAATHLLSDVSGLMGLYVAALCSAALSSISSSMNSLAIVFVEDIVGTVWKGLHDSERRKLLIGKFSVVFIGGIILGFAYYSSISRSNVLQLLDSATGVISGPLMGLYLLGFFCPRSSSRGATAGFILSVAFGLFLLMGNEFLKIPYESNVPPTFVYGCPADNMTTATTTLATSDSMTSASEIRHSALQNLFNMHFALYQPIGLLLTYILGYLISLATGPLDPSECDPRFFIPLVDNKRLPKPVIKFFRFGVLKEHEWEEKRKLTKQSILVHEDKV